MDGFLAVLAGMFPYVPVVALTVFLNSADVYFLQSERFPALHRSMSFWLYLIGHVIVALIAAFLLYEKASLPKGDWPIAMLVSSLTGFSVLQSVTLKFGDKGIDARELFDSWKRRVIEDVSRANASQKRTKQMRVARALAARSDDTHTFLEPAIHQLAPSVQLSPDELIQQMKKSGQNPGLMMAQWIASVDLEYAENLLESLRDEG